MKSVVAAELAALGAWAVLHSGDRVGGIVFNESEVVEVRPHRSQTRVLNLLHAIVQQNQLLASDEPASGHTTLNDALQNALHVANHDHLVILLSDLDGADAETQRLATLIAARNDMLVVAIYDPLGASLVGSPGMIASDRGQSWEIPARDSFTHKFRQSFQDRLDQWQQIFRNLKIPVMPISTSVPPVGQIHAMFGHRPSAK